MLKKFHPEMDVCLLESDICGYGASGRNGGFSMTLFGLTKGIAAFRFDNEKARSAHLYMEQAVDYLHDLITTHNIDSASNPVKSPASTWCLPQTPIPFFSRN